MTADGEFNGLNIRMETGLVDVILAGKNSRTISHEMGHTGNLRHPHSYYYGSSNPNEGGFTGGDEVNKDTNLMSQTWYGARASLPESQTTELTRSQYDYLYRNYKAGNMNQNSPVKTKTSFIFTPNVFGVPIPMVIRSKYLKK